jgi:septum formation protein
MRIVLGSNSPRRKWLLESIFDDMYIDPPRTDESRNENEPPAEYAARVSKDKALATYKKIKANISDGELLVISADTIVCINGMVFGKPGSYNEAVEMLSLISGRTHSVITGISLLFQKNSDSEPRVCTETETTAVTLKSLTREEIKNYLGLIEYMDKAGAYAIQEHGDLILERYDGSLSNIVGFPLRRFFSMISKNGLSEILRAH